MYLCLSTGISVFSLRAAVVELVPHDAEIVLVLISQYTDITNTLGQN